MRKVYKFIIVIIFAIIACILIYNNTKEYTGKADANIKNRIVSYLITKSYTCDNYVCISHDKSIIVDLVNLKYEYVYDDYDLRLTYDANNDIGIFKSNGDPLIIYNYNTYDYQCDESELTCILIKSDLIDLKNDFTNLLATLKTHVSNIKDKNQN